LSEEDKAKLEGLDNAWEEFLKGLDEANVIIQKCYTQLKQEVDSSIEDFKKECQDNKRNFVSQAPYEVDPNAPLDNGKAFEKLQEFKSLTADLRAQEESMKFGLEIFDIEPMSYPEVQLVEKEIEQLTNIWDIKNNWDKQREVWKDIRFYELEVDVMEDESIEYQQKCRGLDKEVKDWHVFKFLKNDVDKFKLTMPLIFALK